MLQQTLQYMFNNKLVVFLGMLSFCTLISTIVLASQKNNIDSELGVCRGELAAAISTTLAPTAEPEATTLAPVDDGTTTPVPGGEETDVLARINYRLPDNVIPSHYKLQLNPYLSTGHKSFDGKLSITINVLNSTDELTLHSNKLNYSLISVSRTGIDIPVQSYNIVPDAREFLTIKMNAALAIGTYDLHLDFVGRLDDRIVGFYESTIKSGQTMAASKFQPTYARQAFPCFDEPEFKATYDISLVKPASYVALSNMNELSSTHDEATNTDVVTFATSVPMSTYLACFVVCDFEYLEVEVNAIVGSNFPLRCYAQKNETHKILFAQDIGKRAAEYYIQYYQVPYPLPKLDMIAIPDYVSGATEHWGLITYRETSFLIDQNTASAANKIGVANTIAHELAHMWFGNLVTMKWWDEVWLNEGFASYMQVKALNAIEPSWTMLDQFLVKTMHPVLNIDAKVSSHPIVQTVETPDQITAIFDSISYNKGSSVLRMLEGFVGEQNFENGVTDYLRSHKFSNTITQDLLDSLQPYFLQNNANLNLTYIMDTWTRQMGYPVVTVSHGDTPHRFVLKQSRFLSNPNSNVTDDSPYNYRWYVPVTYKTAKGASNDILWFPDIEDSVTITLDEDDFWLKINNNQVGYYRVNYPTDMWLNLIDQLQLQSNKLTISDRAHLLNDVFELANARLLSLDLALNLTTYLKYEKEMVPWAVANAIFTQLSERLHNSLAYSDCLVFIQELVTPMYNDLSWDQVEEGSIIKSLLRTKIFNIATKFGLSDAVNKARSMFTDWLNLFGTDAAVTIDPDLRQIIYETGMVSASVQDWSALWQIYLNEYDPQEKAKLRDALSTPRDVTLLTRFLALAWDEANVRAQDFLGVVQSVSSNPAGAAIVWDDVRSRWPQYVERFSLNSRILGNLIPQITKTFNTELKLHEMEGFFATYPEAGAGEAARRRALETVRYNIAWKEHNEPTVAAWLAAHNAQTRSNRKVVK